LEVITVIDFGTNRKRVSEISQVFVLMTPTLFHPNFGGVPVAPGRPCWGQPEHDLKLIRCGIIFEVFQPL